MRDRKRSVEINKIKKSAIRPKESQTFWVLIQLLSYKQLITLKDKKTNVQMSSTSTNATKSAVILRVWDFLRDLWEFSSKMCVSVDNFQSVPSG